MIDKAISDGLKAIRFPLAVMVVFIHCSSIHLSIPISKFLMSLWSGK